jgi:hypothetical protein
MAEAFASLPSIVIVLGTPFQRIAFLRKDSAAS